jgi:hypothetical protein
MAAKPETPAGERLLRGASTSINEAKTFADGHLSDMVNLTRAKDAVANAILAQQFKKTAAARSRAA